MLAVLFGFVVVGSVVAAVGSAVAGELGSAALMLVFACVQTGFLVGSVVKARGGDPLALPEDAAE